MKKVRIKLCLLPKISGVEVAPCLLPKIFGVKVTPSVTSVESSEQFWRKIRQIWRICEPCNWYSAKYADMHAVYSQQVNIMLLPNQKPSSYSLLKVV